jgi:hypothetical protein
LGAERNKFKLTHYQKAALLDIAEPYCEMAEKTEGRVLRSGQAF